MAIRTDGTLWAWGNNEKGQLGDGTTIDKAFPIQIGTDTTWVQVMANYENSIALKADGSIWSWGAGDLGQQPVGSYTSSLVPVQINVVGCPLSVLANSSFENQNNKVVISPNPASSTIDINFSEKTNCNIVEISDLTGRLVLKTNIAAIENKFSLDISNLSQGIYNLVLKNDLVVLGFKKLIKE